MVLNLILGGMLLAGLALGWYQYQALTSQVIVSGRVVDLPQSRGRKGGTTYGVVATFHAADDRSHRSQGHAQEWTYTSSWKASNPGYAIGDPIRICYDPADPARNGIATFTARLGVAGGLVLVPLLVLLAIQAWRVAGAMFEARFPVADAPTDTRLER